MWYAVESIIYGRRNGKILSSIISSDVDGPGEFDGRRVGERRGRRNLNEIDRNIIFIYIALLL